MKFDAIIGHDNIKAQLTNSIKFNKLAHAHVIAGEDGIGKSLIAESFAAQILGKSEDKAHVDIIHWRIAKGKQSIGINDVISIIDEVNKKPYEGDKKVIIVHDSDKMTVEAQNAFLKTIEEPPYGVFIILLAGSSEALLDTIKSRCQIHKLNRLSIDEVKSFLTRKYATIEDSTLNTAAYFSDGIPGRAEKFISDEDFKKVRENVLNILMECNSQEKGKILSFEAFFTDNKNDWRDIFICFISFIRDAIIFKETGNEKLIINMDKFTNIQELSKIYSFNKLSGIMNVVGDAARYLEKNVNMALVIDSMLLKIQEV